MDSSRHGGFSSTQGWTLVEHARFEAFFILVQFFSFRVFISVPTLFAKRCEALQRTNLLIGEKTQVELEPV